MMHLCCDFRKGSNPGLVFYKLCLPVLEPPTVWRLERLRRDLLSLSHGEPRYKANGYDANDDIFSLATVVAERKMMPKTSTLSIC